MFLLRVKRKGRGGVAEQLSKKLHPWKNRGYFILKNHTLCWFSISFNVSLGSENGGLSSGFSSHHFVFIPYL